MAQAYHRRPSEILAIHDDYAAYCVDEACLYILGCLEEGKRPFFRSSGNQTAAGNATTVVLLQKMGAEVRKV